MKKNALTKIVTFRLSEDEYQPYGSLIKEHGYNKSKLFRDIFMDKGERIIAPKIQSKESKRIVFLANKSANNINQIAKKLNESHKSGAISNHVYVETLNRLIGIETLLKSAVSQC